MRSSITPKKPMRGRESRPGPPGRADRLARAEMRGIDARRHQVRIGTALHARRVKAAAAREHDVGAGHQRLFPIPQPRGREVEGGQFVHAVVDPGVRRQVPRDVERHGRLEPQDRRRCPRRASQRPISRRVSAVPSAPRRDLRRQHHDTRGVAPFLQAWQGAFGLHRLLEVGDRPRRRCAAHQMLRALPDEIPAKMGKAQDQVRAGGWRERGMGGHDAASLREGRPRPSEDLGLRHAAPARSFRKPGKPAPGSTPHRLGPPFGRLGSSACPGASGPAVPALTRRWPVGSLDG